LCLWKTKESHILQSWERKEERKIRVCAYRCMGPAQVSSLGGSCYYVLLLVMQPEKSGFIVFKINLMYLILSRNGKLWLKMRQEKDLN